MTRASLVWAIFAAAFLLSTFAGQDPLMSLAGRYSAGAENGVLLLLCWLAFEFGQAHPEPKTMARWMTVAGAVGAAYCLMQRLDLDPWVWTNIPAPLLGSSVGHAPVYAASDGAEMRAMGATGNPVMSGALVALAIPWIPAWLLGLILPGVWATGSRSCLLAAVAALAWRFDAKRLGLKVLVPAALLTVAALVVFHHPVSDRQHVAIARVALRAWLQHPWFGWGPATGVVWFVRCQDAAIAWDLHGYICKHSHNLITNVLATQGLLGLVAWALLIGSAWRASSRATRGALLCVGVFGMFEPVPAPAYVVLALAVGMDAPPPVDAPRRRGWAIPSVAALLFVFLSWEMIAERFAKLKQYGVCADMCPWEFGYCEYDGKWAMWSARHHRGNPLAYFGAVDILRHVGQFKDAEVLVRIENRMDPLKLCK